MSITRLGRQKQKPSIKRLGSTVSKLSDIGVTLNSSPINTVSTPDAIKQNDIIDTTVVPTLDSSVSIPKNLFTVNEGFSNKSPEVIVASEFIPIFDDQRNKNSQSKFLSLKETAKSLNTKVSVNLLSQIPEIKATIEDNKKNLEDFVNDEKIFIDRLLETVKLGRDILKIESYDFNTSSLQDGSIRDLLIKSGYSRSNLEKFSRTKLWNQVLIDLKKSLITNTPGFVNENSPYSRGNNLETDNSEFNLSDIDNISSESYWWNTNSDQISYQEFYDSIKFFQSNQISISEVAKEGDVASISAASAYTTKSQSFNSPFSSLLSAIKSTNFSLNTQISLPPTIQILLDRLNKIEDSFISNIDAVNFSKEKSYSTVVINNGNYASNNKDFLILANIVLKELTYSSFFNKNNSLISNIYNVVTGCNIPVWDSLIGTFSSKDVTNFNESKRTLSGLSQQVENIGNYSYKILTFEEKYFDNKDITPGSYYYIDSSLTTPDGKTFDAFRLNSLESLVNDSIALSDTVLGMTQYGVKDVGINELYEIVNDQITPYTSFVKVTDKLIDLKRFYGNIIAETCNNFCNILGINKDDDALGMLYLAREDLVQGQSGNSSRALSVKTNSLKDEIKKINKNDNKSYRFPAVLCKYANENKDKDLINLLFLWLMCSVIRKSSNDQQQSMQRIQNILRDHIQYFIINQIPNANYENEDIKRSIANNTAFLTNLGKSFQDSSIQTTKEFLDVNSGLWSTIVSVLYDIFSNKDLFNNNGLTRYTGISQINYLYALFRVIISTISNLTPERIVGRYSLGFDLWMSYIYVDVGPQVATYGYIDPLTQNFITQKTNYDTLDQAKSNLDYSQHGILLSSFEIDEGYYSYDFWGPNCKSIKIQNISNLLFNEESNIINKISCIRKLMFSIKDKIAIFKNKLGENYEKHLTEIKSLLDKDNLLDEKTKNAILNLSFKEEQLLMSSYVMSELQDKFENSSEIEEKIKNHSYFRDCSKGFIDFLSMNEMDHLSYSVLSPYFSNSEFLPTKGNNKKIACIGIPPGLNRSLQTAKAVYSGFFSKSATRNVIRIKLYKVDRLHPQIVYTPKSYLFELNRFPTRIIDNWDYESFSKNDINLFNIPTKICRDISSGFILNKDFSEAFPDDHYGRPEEIGNLKQNERYEIYVNHATSFIAEEYLKWFTDCKFDETRYNNFYLSPEITSNITTQYDNFLNQIRVSNAVATGGPTPTQNQTIVAKFNDPISGATFAIPVKKNENFKQESISRNINQTLKKNIEIPLDDSIKKYLANETLLLGTDYYKRRAIYPKKFDRVFSIIFDPDDFVIDQIYNPDNNQQSSLENLVSKGIIAKITLDSINSTYKHRDTTPNDFILEEYFATIEPYSLT